MRNNADQIYSTSRQTGEQCRSPIMETLMRLTEAPICHFICSLRIMGIVRAQLSESHLRLVALAFHPPWQYGSFLRSVVDCVFLCDYRILFVLIFSRKSVYSFRFPYYSFVTYFLKSLSFINMILNELKRKWGCVFSPWYASLYISILKSN